MTPPLTAAGLAYLPHIAGVAGERGDALISRLALIAGLVDPENLLLARFAYMLTEVLAAESGDGQGAADRVRARVLPAHLLPKDKPAAPVSAS